MVQRYLLQGGLIGPHDDGDWVGYEDYAELERKFNELRTWRTQILNDAFDFLTRAKKSGSRVTEIQRPVP